MKNKIKISKRARKVIIASLKITVSITILTFIFYKIDIENLLVNFKKANIYLLVLGMLIGYIMQTFFAAIRWYFSIKTIFRQEVIFSKLLKVFWEGMFLGYFLPASIGWDIYRVIETKKLNIPAYKNIIIIIWEKSLGLTAASILFFVTFPYFKQDLQDSIVLSGLHVLWVTGIAVMLSFVVFIYMSFKLDILKNFVIKYIQFIKVPLVRVFSKLSGRSVKESEIDTIMRELISIFNLNGIIFLLLSALIKILPAISTVLFFYSIGVHISFPIAIFATVVIIFIHMLPISFGSLGVREGAFILIFGIFGISAEQALTVSFFGFFSLILTISLGSISLLSANLKALLLKK